MTRTKRNETGSFQAIGYLAVSLVALACLVPFLLIVSGSITDEAAIFRYGFRLVPAKLSFVAYETLFRFPEKILRAYGVSIGVTVAGSLIGLFLTAMTAYVLLRKSLRMRNQLAFFFYFTALFQGGLIPTYILMVRYLELKDSLLALVVPTLLNSWNIFLMRNYMRAIPESLAEAAIIDGAGEFTIFRKVFLPLSGPGIATIGLFLALHHWNDWYHAMLYIDTETKYPLQYFLHRMLNSTRLADEAGMSGLRMDMPPQESMKMAMAVVATGPIIFAYPFVQKYFVKGLTIGAIKG